MACVMAISCLAVSAFAAESEQEMSITGEKNVFMVDKAASMGSEMTDNVGAKNVFTADGAAASGSGQGRTGIWSRLCLWFGDNQCRAETYDQRHLYPD